MYHNPNYADYSLDDLLDSVSSIDREKYPENYEAIKKELSKRQKGNFECAKCGCGCFESTRIYAARGRLESMFEIESGKFIAVSCIDCGFTEFYKRDSSTSGALADFFIG